MSGEERALVEGLQAQAAPMLARAAEIKRRLQVER